MICSASFQEKFWSRVNRQPADGCWLWIGARSSNGYGSVRLGKRMVNAHRIAWVMYNGEIPQDVWVLHICDVNCSAGDKSYRLCVRPGHMFLGTAHDNAQDASVKGRLATGDRSGQRLHPERTARGDRNGSRLHPERLARGDRNGTRRHPERLSRGEQLHCAKLTDKQVREIRAKYVKNSRGATSAVVLGKEYGVTNGTIQRVAAGKSWTHVV